MSDEILPFTELSDKSATLSVTPKQLAERLNVVWTENLDHEEILHKYYTNQGKTGVHYCPDWDYMAIHDNSHEKTGCTCDQTVSD